MNSLRVRLLVIIGISLVAMWSVVAAWMMVQLRGELRTALDERLAASARMVAGLASQLPSPASGAARLAPQLDVIGRDGLACEVSLLRGEVSVQQVARTAGSPGLQELAPGYSTRVFGGKLWRTYVLHQGSIRVATADRIDAREALLRNVALTAGVPFAFAVVGSLALLWFAIGGGLAPLERMRKVLSARKPEDDSPLPQVDVPRELQPLVGTIARLLQRVRGTIARERRFTDDAAHELRTPLTAIKTHLQVLRLTLKAEAGSGKALERPVQEALDHADEGVLRMQHTIEQLLQLARVDGEDGAAGSGAGDAGLAAMQAIRDAETACGCAGRVVLETADGLPPAAVPQALLASAVRNLLDNALRASPAGTPVLLHVQAQGRQSIRFEVVDEGPGMSEAECAAATSRFWRRSNSGPGSGLGLAIVSAIAQRYGGDLRLEPRAGRGLVARLQVPAAA
jgi:two-component system sensor histidine kinase QseC